ncbi:MAG: phosphatase PAP2 family protein [Methylophilus sp.]|jgi:lipid A 4'-phosphatase
MSLQLLEFAQFSKTRSLLALKYSLPVCLILALFFISFSQLDLMVSHLFFRDIASNPDQLLGFWLAQSPLLRFVCKAVDVVSRLALFSSMLIFVWYLFKKNARAFYAAIVLFSLLAGPLYMVNGVFKEEWGRARPNTVEQFSGAKKFTTAWQMTNQCEHNCAFTSGHAAAGFALCVAFFVSRRKVWLPAGIALGASIGVVRIVMGAHFLSDVIFSFFLVFISSAIVTYLLSQITLKFLNHRA